MDSFSKTVDFVTIVVPTIMLYAWPFWFAAFASRAASGRKRWLFAGLAVLPFAVYAARYLTTYHEHQRLDAIVRQAQDGPRLADPPRVLVFHGPREDDWPDRLVGMGMFDEVYIDGPYGRFRLATKRGAECERRGAGSDFYAARMGYLVCAVSAKVDRVPAEGLHLYTSRDISPALEPARWITALELRLVDKGQQRTIGFWGIPQVLYPAFPPVLALDGFKLNGSLADSPIPMPYFREVALLTARLEVDTEHLRPREVPSPDEVRAAFVRRVDSRDLRAAGNIAVAAGATALTADDVELLLASKDARQFHWGDAAAVVGHVQFCGEINRLCDFPRLLVAHCRRTHSPRGDQSAAAGASAICDRIPAQCAWCAENRLCELDFDQRTDRCPAKGDDLRRLALDKNLDQ